MSIDPEQLKLPATLIRYVRSESNNIDLDELMAHA